MRRRRHLARSLPPKARLPPVPLRNPAGHRPAAIRAGLLCVLVAIIVGVAATVGIPQALGGLSATPASVGSSASRATSAPAGLNAAGRFLRLTNERLALMKAVMETKWLSRSPIQDRAQEERVVQGALVSSRKLGLADAGVRRVFAQEILAAKEVQLGWGTRWLWYGLPDDIKPPDLERLRAQIAALTPELIDALAGLGQLHCQPGVHVTLTRASRQLIRISYLSDRRRAALVTALLSVRHVGSSRRG